MRPGRSGPASAGSPGALRAGGRAFAAAVLVLAALGVAARPAAAADLPSDPERATTALEREADRLEALASGPRAGGADWTVDVVADLTVADPYPLLAGLCGAG